MTADPAAAHRHLRDAMDKTSLAVRALHHDDPQTAARWVEELARSAAAALRNLQRTDAPAAGPAPTPTGERP